MIYREKPGDWRVRYEDDYREEPSTNQKFFSGSAERSLYGMFQNLLAKQEGPLTWEANDEGVLYSKGGEFFITNHADGYYLQKGVAMLYFHATDRNKLFEFAEHVRSR
jgi:hypothetical protein